MPRVTLSVDLEAHLIEIEIHRRQVEVEVDLPDDYTQFQMEIAAYEAVELMKESGEVDLPYNCGRGEDGWEFHDHEPGEESITVVSATEVDLGGVEASK